MGLSLVFLIGKERKIIRAIKKLDYSILDNPISVHKEADFSFHLQPKDLNELSKAIGNNTNQTPLELRPFLKVLIDEIDHGLLSVDPVWVKYASKVEPSNILPIVTMWETNLSTIYTNETIIFDDAIQKSVLDLVELCKYSLDKRLRVLHLWTL